MPLSIQIGDLAERLRNLTRVTGRVPLGLDETVVPTAQIADVEQSPYRRNPRGFIVSYVGPLAAGLQVVAGIETTTSLVKVLRVTMSSSSTQSPLFLLWLPPNTPISAFAAVGAPQTWLTERPVSTGLGTAQRPATASYGGTGLGLNALQALALTMLSNRPFVHEPKNLILPPGDPITGSGHKLFALGAVSTPLNVTFECEEYATET